METTAASGIGAGASTAYRLVYRLLGYAGILSIFGAQAFGFRFAPQAHGTNYLFDLGLYLAFIVPHLVMTRGWFKRRVWGTPAGHPSERRFYVSTTLVTWFAVLALSRPLPGPELALPEVVRFAGMLGFLAGFLLFFQGISIAMLDGLLGVPGSAGSYSHGKETPLFTEGAYARVRHPMYRAAMLGGLSSLLVHPNVGQLFWIGLIGATFIAFIPVEEAQLVAARGEDYLRYREQTPWRLFRGIW